MPRISYFCSSIQNTVEAESEVVAVDDDTEVRLVERCPGRRDERDDHGHIFIGGLSDKTKIGRRDFRCTEPNPPSWRDIG